MLLGHSASQAPVLVQLPKPSSSIFAKSVVAGAWVGTAVLSAMLSIASSVSTGAAVGSGVAGAGGSGRQAASSVPAVTAVALFIKVRRDK